MWKQNCGWCQHLLTVTILDPNLAGSQSSTPPKTECGLVSTSAFTTSVQNFALEGMRDSFSLVVYLFSDHVESPLETSDSVIMGQRTGEGGTGRKVWEGCRGCWGPLPSCLDVYPPHFSKLDPPKCPGPLPSRVPSLHSGCPLLVHSLQSEPGEWVPTLPGSTFLLLSVNTALQGNGSVNVRGKEEKKHKAQREQKGDRGQELTKKEKQVMLGMDGGG